MKTDPICGMTVDETTALKAVRAGQTHYFCSEHCRTRFLTEGLPTRRLAMAPAGSPNSCCNDQADANCCSPTGEHDQHPEHTPQIETATENHACCSHKPVEHHHHGHAHDGHHRDGSAKTVSGSVKY